MGNRPLKTGAGPLRVAVVGAGVMGRNHLRIYSLLKDVELVAIVDPVRERAEAAAEQHGCRIFEKLDDLAGEVDAASVTAPSPLHGEIGCALLDNGIHCLIEKPLATTEEDCRALIRAAEKNDRVLLVGHVERFNPAVQKVAEILDGGHRVHAIEARRMNWASGRVFDTGVVSDLMVHDLDIVLSLLRQPAEDVSAHGLSVYDSTGADHATATLAFPGGALCTLTASRITQNRIRELTITSDIGFLTLDYSRQEILIHRSPDLAPPSLLHPKPGSYVLDFAMERVLVRGAEPLMVELRHFVRIARDRGSPLVTGRQALEALRLAWSIEERIGQRF